MKRHLYSLLIMLSGLIAHLYSVQPIHLQACLVPPVGQTNTGRADKYIYFMLSQFMRFSVQFNVHAADEACGHSEHEDARNYLYGLSSCPVYSA